ncbi:glycosyltransferase family 39 protein [Patescibacteria group bacterium]|nr:glycosyltransferase family 39 protein [Patescibacteria group bacterium]
MRKKKDNKIGNNKDTRVLSIVLIFIVLLGLILRLTGIKHGFPFIFHPDEPTIIRSALGVRFSPNPKHFDWPHLYIYLNYFLYMAFARFRSFIVTIGLRDKSALLLPLIWDENLIYYYLTRCFSAILGALTAVPVYLAGKELFGKRAGILGALAINIMPYHMWHSHYALGDIPMTFLLAWALYFSALIIKRDEVKNYVFSGLFIGLAASVKYNGGLAALMVPVAHFLKIFWKRKNLSKGEKSRDKTKILDGKGVLALFLSGLSAFFGFLIGTPYALFDYKTFSRTDGPAGAYWQFTNVGSVSFPAHIMGFFGDISGRLTNDTGFVVMPIFILGLFYLIFRLVRKNIEEKDIYLVFLYTISIFLIWYISGFKNSRSHYYFIVYPYVAVIFGFFSAFLQNIFRNRLTRQKNEKLIKTLSWVLIFLLFLPLFVKSSINSYRYYMGDTRNMLYEWLIQNYHPGESLVYNDKALEDVFGKIGIRSHKGLDNFDNFSRSIIVINEPGESEVKFFEKNSELIEKVVVFDSSFRLGKDIEVYRYERPCGCQ